ncbi:hypothetical protein BKA66DRAFT_567027 [Pyrenochaeta sp. MPI-SDFR-AT-0127]|nr:hypothetical protein BKA66DRAFT_567027 [Pyrenochaeta sp. MPI-SDFR-AT-0127]
MVELMLPTSDNGIPAHFGGLGALISLFPSELFSSGDFHAIFVGCRPVLLFQALTARPNSDNQDNAICQPHRQQTELQSRPQLTPLCDHHDLELAVVEPQSPLNWDEQSYELWKPTYALDLTEIVRHQDEKLNELEITVQQLKQAGVMVPQRPNKSKNCQTTLA